VHRGILPRVQERVNGHNAAMRSFIRGVLLALALAMPVHAQQPNPANGLFLVAKPDMVDPNFSRTVVLVSQTEDYRTIGVIINRPLDMPVEIPGLATPHYRDKLYFGGPVSREAIVAVFRSAQGPKGPAQRVLRDIYLSYHKETLTALIADAGAKYRLYAGFSGWAPRQLESEMQRDGWYVLPADEATIFREDTSGIWDELVQKVRGPRAGLSAD
jgi:putative transcriptional regulator